MYLLDTNICIYLIKNTFPQLTERVLKTDPEEMAISAVTLYELEYGAAKSNWGERTRENLHIFLEPFTLIPFDAGDAITAGRLRALLTQHGTPIGPYDIQIAAQGLSREMTIITHNTKEFSRVPNLKIEDWIQLS